MMKIYTFLVLAYFSIFTAYAQDSFELNKAIENVIKFKVHRDSNYIKDILLPEQESLFHKEFDTMLEMDKWMSCRVGGYINKVEMNGDQAIVELLFKSFKGDGINKNIFRKVNGKWKYVTTLTQESMKRAKENFNADVASLKYSERFLLLVSDWEKFRSAKQQVSEHEDIIKYLDGKGLDGINYETFIRGAALVVEEMYTEKELKEMIDFFENQTGLKFLYTQNKFDSLMNQMLRNFCQEEIKKALTKRRDEELKEDADLINENSKFSKDSE